VTSTITAVEMKESGSALPIRLTTREVCALARFSRVTLWQRIKAGRMPAPIDHGRQSIFDRDAVLEALRPVVTMSTPERDPNWAANVIAERTASLQRRRANLK
jgi:excisionase family DNA binding protein